MKYEMLTRRENDGVYVRRKKRYESHASAARAMSRMMNTGRYASIIIWPEGTEDFYPPKDCIIDEE